MRPALSLVAAFVALWPSVALAADASDPQSLRAILPDAVDTTFVEALPGQQGYLDGPVTYDSITDYYTYFKQSASFIESELKPLRDNRYEAGYQRAWYRRGGANIDLLSEQVLVFASPALARSAADEIIARDRGNFPSLSEFDPQLGPGSQGEEASLNGYTFVDVLFLKGDAIYSVEMGTAKVPKQTDINPQAQALFAAAPANIALPPPPQSALARYRLPVVVTFVSGAALIAIALVIIVIATITAPRAAAPRHA